MAEADYEKSYAGSRAYFGSVPNRWLAEFLGREGKGRSVLDLGCGQGRNALYLARRGYVVTAVDSSRAAIDGLKAQAREENLPVEAICEDICDFPVSADFYDAIVAVTVLCHLDASKIAGTAGRLAEGLRPNGLFLIEEFTLNDPGARGDRAASEFAPLVENYFSPDRLQALFPSLERVSCRILSVADDSHGKRHIHSLVRYVGRKVRNSKEEGNLQD